MFSIYERAATKHIAKMARGIRTNFQSRYCLKDLKSADSKGGRTRRGRFNPESGSISLSLMLYIGSLVGAGYISLCNVFYLLLKYVERDWMPLIQKRQESHKDVQL